MRSHRAPAEIMHRGRNLKVIIRAGAGYDTSDTAAARERGIRVANWPGKNSVAVAELVMGLMIAVDRRIPDNVADLRSHKWNKKLYSQSRGLKGRTLGIIGAGRIGSEVARRALAFEMNVLFFDVLPDVCPYWLVRNVEAAVLSQADGLGVAGLALNAAGVTEVQVALCRANGTRARVWGLRGLEDLAKVAELGVEAATVDWPGRARECLEQRGLE